MAVVHVILVPGFWLDASSWDEVVPGLARAGHHTHALTLPGMESETAARAGITLADHVGAVVAVIDSLDPAAGQVALVGHSGGGAVVHAAADARPDRVTRVVYVDSWPAGDGDVINAGLPAENGEVPLPEWSLFDDADLVDLSDDLRAAFRARAIPTPEHVARDALRLSDERRYDVPATVIACEYPSAQLQDWMAQGEPNLQELGKLRDVEYIDLPTGHWPQLTKPDELAAVIVQALTGRAPQPRRLLESPR